MSISDRVKRLRQIQDQAHAEARELGAEIEARFRDAVPLRWFHWDYEDGCFSFRLKTRSGFQVEGPLFIDPGDAEAELDTIIEYWRKREG